MKRSARSAAAVAKKAMKEDSAGPRQKKVKDEDGTQQKSSILVKNSAKKVKEPNSKLETLPKPLLKEKSRATGTGSIKISSKSVLPIIAKLTPATDSDNESQTDDGVSPYFLPKPLPSNFMSTTCSAKLQREFFDQDCLKLCKALLGTVLVRRLKSNGEILKGTIVETEAYPGGNDRASQSYQGKRTPRNEAMFLDPGTAYVYFTYGMYYCFNISSQGEGAACLIRAVEPLQDYEAMHELRKPSKKKKTDSEEATKDSDKPKKRLKLHELANGPSKLCMAFDIRRDNCDKIDMTSSDDLWLELSEDAKFRDRQFEINTDKRIGIDSTPPEARNKLWRFFVKDSFYESRAKVNEIKKRLAN